MFVNDWDKLSNPYRKPSIGASYQVSVHLAKRFHRRFLEIDQSETRIACDGHVCTFSDYICQTEYRHTHWYEIPLAHSRFH
jgi:hypothetical protein